MADTLTTILQQMVTDLGQWVKIGNDIEFTATGGSATTAVNAGFGTDYEEGPDEETFKYHSLFVTYDAGGAGASPQGRFAKISSYSGTTITHATVTDAIASGDKFRIANQSLFPVQALIDAVNGGLKSLGLFALTNRSLTTASSQTEFTLPSGIMEILDIRRQEITTDSNDNRYYSFSGWRIVPPTTTLSTAPVLFIPQQEADYILEIKYNGYHPSLSLYSDTIYPFIQSELVVAAAIAKLLEGYINQGAGQTDQHWKNMYTEAFNAREMLSVKLAPYRPKKTKVAPEWPELQ